MSQKIKQLKFLEEFKIDKSDLTFRFSKVKPTTCLSLMSQISKDNFQTTEETYDFILEHTEVKVNDAWVKVKERDVYYPVYLEEQIWVLHEIVVKFIMEVLTPSFMKSNELIKN